MKTSEIKVGRVYRGADGKTLKVMELITQLGKKEKKNVRVRNETQLSEVRSLKKFAEWATRDITPAPTALARS